MDSPSRADESSETEVLGIAVVQSAEGQNRTSLDEATTPSTPVQVEAVPTRDALSPTQVDESPVTTVADSRAASPPATTTTTKSTTTATVGPRSTTTSDAPPVDTFQTITDQALASIRFDWKARFPEWEIVFLGDRSGIRALTYPREHRIEVFVRESESVQSLHRVIAHELGHVVDVELNDAEDRNGWLAQRGIGGSVPWWPNESAPDFATGAGDFAEAFAVWETGVRSQSTLAGQPSPADLSLLGALVGS